MSAPRVTEVLSFDDFIAALAKRLHIDPHVAARPQATFESWQLDGLAMFVLLVLMDELGAEVPVDMVTHIESIAELYDHYCRRVIAETSGW